MIRIFALSIWSNPNHSLLSFCLSKNIHFMFRTSWINLLYIKGKIMWLLKSTENWTEMLSIDTHNLDDGKKSRISSCADSMYIFCPTCIRLTAIISVQSTSLFSFFNNFDAVPDLYTTEWMSKLTTIYIAAITNPNSKMKTRSA